MTNDIYLINQRIHVLRQKESRLLKLKKSERRDLKETQTSISNLKRWKAELETAEYKKKMEGIGMAFAKSTNQCGKAFIKLQESLKEISKPVKEVNNKITFGKRGLKITKNKRF